LPLEVVEDLLRFLVGQRRLESVAHFIDRRFPNLSRAKAGMHLDVVDAVANRAAGNEHLAARTRRRFGLSL